MPRRVAVGIELLADPTRRRLVALIAGGIRHPSDLAAILGLGRPAVSRQLRLLLEAGLLRWTPSLVDRRARVYVVDPVMEPPIIAWLAGVDLRNVRPRFAASWSPPMRVHRVPSLARHLHVDRDS